MKILGWLLLMLLIAPVAFAGTEPKITPPQGPIEVTSNRMESDQKAGKVVFIGNVVGKRGAMTIYADQMTLFFLESAAGKKIDRIEASGQVRVIEPERTANADRLDYLQSIEKMTLSGHAEVHQGTNLVAGDEIEIFVREDRSLVKSGKDGRVRAVFTPPAKEQP